MPYSIWSLTSSSPDPRDCRGPAISRATPPVGSEWICCIRIRVATEAVGVGERTPQRVVGVARVDVAPKSLLEAEHRAVVNVTDITQVELGLIRELGLLDLERSRHGAVVGAQEARRHDHEVVGATGRGYLDRAGPHDIPAVVVAAAGTGILEKARIDVRGTRRGPVVVAVAVYMH